MRTHGQNIRRHEFLITGFVIAAGFVMVAAWFAQLVLEERRPAPSSLPATVACGICGVVERVTTRPVRIYETSVLHDDGSVRVLHDTSASQWKTGDRVKVIKGRVIRRQEEPAASQTGRTATPGPQAARAW